MFEDIAELEKEIETFRKNVVASSELVEGINQLTEATKLQKKSFTADANKLVKKLDSSVEQFKSDHEASLKLLSANNKAEIVGLQRALSAEQKTKIAELEMIKAEIQDTKAGFSSDVKQAETLINMSQKELENSLTEMKKDYQTALIELESQVNSGLQNFQKMAAADYQARVNSMEKIGKSIDLVHKETVSTTDAQIQKLTEKCNQIIKSMQADLEAQQSTYIKQLETTENTIKMYQTETEKKYNDFIHILETTNLDRLSGEVTELKETMKKRFILLIGGIGISLILSAIGLFLK